MKGRYLLRFDDICPRMDWEAWEPLEDATRECGIKPILAVVPDCQDPKLNVGPPVLDFWARVRGWQAEGWAIGLHGFQHRYATQDPGILGLHPSSEFAGLAFEDQVDKLRRGLAIFRQEGVRADCFIAPGHSLDWTTVAALQTVGLRVISDGLALGPCRDALGTIWVPQQIASIRPIPVGVWTFCYHAMDMPCSMTRFRRDLAGRKAQFITLPEAVRLGDHPPLARDRLVAVLRRGLTFAKRYLPQPGS